MTRDSPDHGIPSMRQTFSQYKKVLAPTSQPLSQPGCRSTVCHDAAVGASEAGVLDYPELRRCRVGVPLLRPHRNVPAQQRAGGKRAGVVRAVPPAQQAWEQARERPPACPPSCAPLHQDSASFPKTFSGHRRFYRCWASCPCCWVATLPTIAAVLVLCVFSLFFRVPGARNGPIHVSRTRPGHIVAAPGRLLRLGTTCQSEQKQATSNPILILV